MRCAMYEPPPGSAPGYQLAHQLTAMGKMKIMSANSDMLKLGSKSRMGWPVPSFTDITGCALAAVLCTTCSVDSRSVSSLRPSQPLGSPARRRPTSTSENHAAANTAVILMKN